MSLVTGVTGGLNALSAAVKGLAVDVVATSRLERDSLVAARDLNRRSITRLDTAAVTAYPWADTTGWTGTGVVAANRIYSTAGITRAIPANNGRWVLRTTLHVTGVQAAKYAYMGVGSSGAAADLVGIGQTSSSVTAFLNRGANISAGAVGLPRALPALTAGDYLCTVSKDETTVSFTIQAVAGGQFVYGARIPVSAFPGGVVNTMFVSANDTTAGGVNFGPMLFYGELAVPPSDSWSVAGTALFGANKPLSFYRMDPTTSIGHIISVPGDMDARKPAPVMMFAHQASTGVAVTPWSETRMANVTSAMETAGYIIAASDNGPGVTGGGTQDKFANDASLADYAALVAWVRDHFYTGSLVLYGPSQGSFVSQNLLMNKVVGGIAAVATVSGGSNLIAMEQDPAYQAALWSAYGVASTPAFVAAATSHDPMSQPGWKFRGVPQRFYVGSTDTTAPPGVQVTPFVAKIGPYTPEASVTSSAVGHLDPALYQGADTLAFYQKYVRNGDYVIDATGYAKRDRKNANVSLTNMNNDYAEVIDIINDGTATSGWRDRLQYRFATAVGATPRNTFTLNEYGEPRVTPAKYNTTAFRLFAKEFNADTARDMTVALMEVYNDRDNRVTQFAIYGDGDVYTKKDIAADGNIAAVGTVTGSNIGLKIEGIYNTGSEPAGAPNGTIILVRP